MSDHKLAEALRLVREIIAEGAATGFDCHSGNWADRLFRSQHDTHKALAAHEAQKLPSVQKVGPDDATYTAGTALGYSFANSPNPASGTSEQQAGEAVAWLVIDSTGQPMHAAGWKAAAHEHINDALNEYGIAEAAKWRVIPVFTHPQQPLTREQCIKLWGDRSDGPSNGEIVSFTRAIEAAHGITKDTK